MSNFFNLRIDRFFIIILFSLVSCKSIENLPGGDARKNPPDPRERVKKNLEEGKGFRLDTALKGAGKGGDFMFASANELWRASLDTIDFMPLSSVNYSGGIIITDWYSDGNNIDESVKISIRFLTNEVRSDGLRIIVHKRRCTTEQLCTVKKISSTLEQELQVAILKKATIYQREYQKGKKKFKRQDIKD